MEPTSLASILAACFVTGAVTYFFSKSANDERRGTDNSEEIRSLQSRMINVEDHIDEIKLSRPTLDQSENMIRRILAEALESSIEKNTQAMNSLRDRHTEDIVSLKLQLAEMAGYYKATKSKEGGKHDS